MASKVRQKQQGFTLIELLIAMSIAAVISLLAYQSIDSSVRTNQSLQQHQQDFRQLQSAWWWLEQDLTQLAPRAVNDGLGGTLPALNYRIDIPLEFSRFSVADSPLAMSGRYGVIRIAYLLEDRQLIRLQWPVLDRAPDSQPSRRVLLEDIEQFAVRFLDENGQWQETWPPVNQPVASVNNRLPKAVEVALTAQQGEVKRLFAGVDWLDFEPYKVEQTGTTTETGADSEETASDTTQVPQPTETLQELIDGN